MSEARATLDTAISEAAFQDAIVDLARSLGWITYHTHDSRRSDAGFPDLVLAKPGHQIIMAELKTQSGRMKGSQYLWGGVLAACPGVRYWVWRPSQWDAIEALLREEGE